MKAKLYLMTLGVALAMAQNAYGDFFQQETLNAELLTGRSDDLQSMLQLDCKNFNVGEIVLIGSDFGIIRDKQGEDDVLVTYSYRSSQTQKRYVETRSFACAEVYKIVGSPTITWKEEVAAKRITSEKRAKKR